MSVLKFKNKGFDTAIQSGVALVNFYADWCGPCKMMSPIADEIADERTDITVVKVNVGESSDLASHYGIVGIPTMIVFKHSKESCRIIGARPKAAILTELDK